MDLNYILSENFDKFKYDMLRVYLDVYDGLETRKNKLGNLLKLYDIEKVLAITSCYYESKNEKTTIINALHSRGLINGLYFDLKGDRYVKFNAIYCKLNDSIVGKLNKIIVEKDFSVEPILYLDLFYIDMINRIIINPYDDRGVDFIFMDNDINKINKLTLLLSSNSYMYDYFKPS